MARRAPRCDQCGHLQSLHLPACLETGCRCAPHRRPTPTYSLTGPEVVRLTVLVDVALRGLDQLETWATVQAADTATLDALAAGRAGLLDLLHALATLREHGILPDPIRRWTLGIPPWALEQPHSPRGGKGMG